MATMNRRQMLATVAGTGAVLAIPGSELFAQQNNLQFVPLQLNRAGQGLVNQNVSTLGQHEDDLLGDLLGGNQQREIRDLGAIQRDFQGIQQAPGIQLGQLDQRAFGQEITQITNQVTVVVRQRRFLRGIIFRVVKMIDTFVSHWYPCNDILQIGHCENQIWKLCQARRPDFTAIEYYTEHLRYEVGSLFNFHRGGGQFPGQSRQLMGVLTQFEQTIIQQNVQQCRNQMMRFSMASDLLCRKYYPQWC